MQYSQSVIKSSGIYLLMKFNTAIFDMDGLLIDSEPLWNEAATTVFETYNIHLTKQQYSTTTGLRTKEFVQWWFSAYNVSLKYAEDAEEKIVKRVNDLVIQKGRAMPGLEHILNFFISRNFKIGLASSSPLSLINTVIDVLKVRNHLNVYASAAELEYGKPHPEVYLNCARQLSTSPLQCICFEDSFYGMIAAKAASMKCVVVPDVKNQKDNRWSAADLKIASLSNFNELLLLSL